ncbi:unnamed protein product [Rhizophagus irregularis]|nr:unnamed protein product [Rhizophagus irregularis]CAB5388266.1 unnamed protein product [Rhizophagus irregularis]
MYSKSPKIFNFLLLSFLLCFIQISLCEVESNDKRFSPSSHNNIEKRALSAEVVFQYTFGGIALGLFGLFLLLCFGISFCLNRKAMSGVILSIPWTLLDFILDALFVKNQGKDVPSLYVPSIIFLIGPVIVNIVLSLMIIINEKKKGSTEFRRWFYDNSSFAATAAVLAGADMSTLKLLYSEIFRMKKFNAPFSDDSKTMILWGCVISSIIADIPQFVIQILYKREVEGDYTLIPFLKLITISVKLPIAIIGRVFEALKDRRKPDKRRNNDNDNNNDNNNNDVEK